MKYVNDLHAQRAIFSSKLRNIMIKREMTYDNGKPDPIDLYNILYPNDYIDKKERGFHRSDYTDKVRKYDNWIKGNNYPKNISDVLKLCNALKCDLDYFFTDMESSTHDIEFISSETGLSEDAILKLKKYLGDEKPREMFVLNELLFKYFDIISSITDYILFPDNMETEFHLNTASGKIELKENFIFDSGELILQQDNLNLPLNSDILRNALLNKITEKLILFKNDYIIKRSSNSRQTIIKRKTHTTE